ncbi:MAG: acetyl-CoA carboxylase biotin carboxylase subunit family protein [Candidatus Babeliales bacterium]
MKKKIFIPYPSARDIRELTLLEQKLPYTIVFDACTRGNLEHAISMAPSAQAVHDLLEKSITERVALCKRKNIAGIGYSNDYPTNPLSVCIAQHAGLVAPDLAVLLSIHHKYYSRILQQQYVPEAVPSFDIIACDVQAQKKLQFDYPFFIKPVKSYLSMGAYHVATDDHLLNILKKKHVPRHFIEPFNYLLAQYTKHEHNGNYMIVEGVLTGDQVTLEGYVFNGACHIMGITDSIMYPGTQSFERFEYPTALSPKVINRLEDITYRLIKGIGLDNTMFNIEFIYDKEKDLISIIEINPRMAHQFADLYEKVDGINGYQIMLDIAAGHEPIFKKGQGAYARAASCVLRTFENKRVKKTPTPHELHEIQRSSPDIRIELYAVEGSCLHEQDQDTASYRYAIINIGGHDHADLMNRFRECKDSLNFVFESI